MAFQRLRGVALLFVLAAVGWPAADVTALDGSEHAEDDEVRPVVRVQAPEHGCGVVVGRYVALLDPALGILLISGAPFPGGEAVDRTGGPVLRLAGVRRGSWEVAAVDSSGPVWGTRLGFRGAPITGCLGFDKDRFSAEGDLASYLYWLVDSVYSELPEAERRREPGFRLSDRQVTLRVSRPGQGSIELLGKEGATLACRFGDGERTYLAIPFVLDGPTARIAVKVGYTDRPYWEAAEKAMVGVVVTVPGVPAAVPELGLEVVAESVTPAGSG